MPKSLCVIDSVRAEIGPKFFVSYTISIDVPVLNFASEFQVDTALTVAINVTPLPKQSPTILVLRFTRFTATVNAVST